MTAGCMASGAHVGISLHGEADDARRGLCQMPQRRMGTESTRSTGEQGMVWRLYDTLNDCWYNDELYDSREACIAAGTYYQRSGKRLKPWVDLFS